MPKWSLESYYANTLHSSHVYLYAEHLYDGKAFCGTKARQLSAWLLGEIAQLEKLVEQAGGPGFNPQSPHKKVRVMTLAILALGSQDGSTGKGACCQPLNSVPGTHMVEGELTVGKLTSDLCTHHNK